jgi:hypothetical protein
LGIIFDVLNANISHRKQRVFISARMTVEENYQKYKIVATFIARL